MELGGTDAATACACCPPPSLTVLVPRTTPVAIQQMELGGKDAAIVCADADLAEAAKHIVKGAFSYSGQRCTGARAGLERPGGVASMVGAIRAP